MGAHKPGFATSKGSIVKRSKQGEKQVHFSYRLDIVPRTVIESRYKRYKSYKHIKVIVNVYKS